MKRQRDLSNQQFVRWNVLPEYRYQSGNKQWLCECSCEAKTRRYVFETNLVKGLSKSCGCLAREMAQSRYIDLAGQQFGSLVVENRAENKNGRTAWNCLCECGNTKVLTTHELIQEGRKSCGCRIYTKGRNIRDLREMEFEALKALCPTNERDYKGSVMWHCRCKKCGREIELSEDALVHGNYSSCGCTRYDHASMLAEYKHYYQGTCLESLRRRMRSDNKTGVIGVNRTKSGKYKAQICFQGRTYQLGSYEMLEEAAAKRKEAEEQLHQSFIKAYSLWVARKEEAVENQPFVFEVNYINGEFLIYTNYLPKQ